MMSAHIDAKRAVPLWAAFGAPMLGVPLLVGLLALGAPDRAEANGAPEMDATYTIEAVEERGDEVERTADVGLEGGYGVNARC